VTVSDVGRRSRGGDPLADASLRPYWLDRSGVPAPAKRSSIADEPVGGTVDLAVVGGGLTGLWAAVEAARLGQHVVLVDAGSVATGASGRCGGFINASITHGIPHGHARWPDEMDRIVALQTALWHDTLAFLEEIGAADVVQPVGKLTVATREQHVPGLVAAADLLRRYGQDVRLLDSDDLGSIVRSPTYLGGYRLSTANGLCDPARLAWALAAAAERAGVRIRESSPVESLDDDGSVVMVRTADGSLRARRVLLATNAFTPLLRRLRLRIIPVYDHVVVTAPLTAEQWDAIGWAGGSAGDAPGITDAGNQFHYYRPTPDGGVLFGGWDATYHFGGRVDTRYEHQPATHRLLVEHLVETFPALSGVAVTHAWGGPIDSTSRFTPCFGTAMGGKVGWAVGFTGLGVGSSRFAALAALDLLGGRATERTALRMVERSPIPFPPEPLRTLAVAATKRSLVTEDRTGHRNLWLRALDRFGVGFDT
jgi:glycine/D-amino acid oxidase-like deaminating enzyme